MSAMEVILLILGAGLFVASYIIPEKKEEADRRTRALARTEIQKMVSGEMEEIKDHLDEVVDETITYAMEKTERSLERLSNEKIMAVSEYSDTVLQEIHKNHEEVMFLYDMLNNKQVNLNQTVTEINQTVKEVEETKKEAMAVVDSIQRLGENDNTDTEEKQHPEVETKKTSDDTEADSAVDEFFPESEEEFSMDGANISFMGSSEGRNSNERIIELFKQGKSNVEIAKELGLGVGEVKLVINLYNHLG